MATIHAQLIGDQAVLPRSELERLVEIARQSEPIDLELTEGDVLTREIMRLADQGGAFDFWKEEAENLYSPQDGEPL
jgi:hypothetical protein